MGTRNNDYAQMGLRALQRAARKVAEEARAQNLQIPIWRDGKIEYIIPEMRIESRTSAFAVPQIPNRKN